MKQDIRKGQPKMEEQNIIQPQQQEKFKLTITADQVTSTDERFTMDNLHLGDNYRPLEAFFKK